MTGKGVEETRMQDIASAADYTRRTLYSYFKSRDEVYLTLLVEDMQARWAAQKKALEAGGCGLDKIMTWGVSFCAFARANPHSMRLAAYWDFRGIDRSKVGDQVFREFESINHELADGLRAVFHAGIADGSLRPGLDADMCISQFLAALRGVVNRALLPTYSFATFEPGEYMKHFLDLFNRSIRNDGGHAE